MDCIHAGIAASERGIAAQTLAKQHRSVSRFTQFLAACGIRDNPFLDGFTQEQRILILSGYAHHVRQNRHGSTSKDRLQGTTVSAAISDVVQTFRSNLRPDPTHDRSNQKSTLIQRQLKAYRATDPARKSQACLPIQVWMAIGADRSSSLTCALGDLIIGALFFAMRSCEYSSTAAADGPRKTKILTCDNIQFLVASGSGIQALPHSLPCAKLEKADCIAIRFVAQKNNENFIKVTQYRSGKCLCPVIAWARTVKRVLGYPKASPSSTVNTFIHPQTGSQVRISAAQVRAHIRLNVTKVGAQRLGVDIKRVGTHSLRTSCAMLLYLAKVRTETIKLIGRWKSDAFLLYIRRQVQEFAEGLSNGMMSLPPLFHNIPDDPALLSEASESPANHQETTPLQKNPINHNQPAGLSNDSLW
jgi:hypothetical protein